MSKKISVVIPARDSSKTIIKTLKSLNEQTHKPYEVIIVASKNDSTRQVIGNKKYIKYIEVNCNDTYIRDSQYKRWIGAKKAEGDYIFFTDAKAYLNKDALKIALELIKSQGVEVVAGAASSWEEEKNLLVSKFQDKALIRNNPKFKEKSILNISNFGKTESLPVTTALLISKKAFNVIKNDFALDYSKYATTYDDYVTAWLLVKNGFEILLSNRVISYHKHRTSWIEYYRQISRSGQSAGLMTKFYPDCPFGIRRKRQVYVFIIGNILLFGLSLLSVLLFPISVVFIIATYITLLVFLGILNSILEKDPICIFFPPLTYLLILIFSINLLIWISIDPDKNKKFVSRYLQIN